MKIKLPHIFLLLVSLICCSGCYEALDFEQANDLKLNPTFISSLAYFDTAAPAFIVNPGDDNFIQETVSLSIFDEPFVVDNLTRADFVFETSNSILRDFNARVDFFDANRNLQHSFTIQIPNSTDNTDNVNTHTEVFEGDTLIGLKNTTVIVFTLTIIPSNTLPVITEETIGRLKLRSFGVFYLNIN